MIFENEYKNINNAAICSLTAFDEIFHKTKQGNMLYSS
jgi:hypothetical protein